MFRNLKLVVSCIALLTGLFVVGVDAQRTKKTISLNPVEPEANPAYDLDQCRNGAVEDATNPDCIDTGTGASGWVNGNAGNSNSHWQEAQFIAYRLRFSNLTNGSHTVVLQYDIRHSDKMAIDYLGSYNVTETDAIPCSGVAGCTGAPDEFPIPDAPEVVGSINPNTGNPIQLQGPRIMSLWGGEITNIYYLENPFAIDPNTNQQARTVVVEFNSTVSNPVLAWGGHIAWRGDWGAGNSAGGVSGSPYHMRVLEFDGQGGNQDRSLSADAVDATGGIIITKVVETTDNTDASTQAFTFTANSYFPNPADPQNVFQLVDNIAGADGASRESAPIFATSSVSVTESETLGWTLLDISCVDPTGDSTVNIGTRTASINVTVTGTTGELVECTFVNGQQNASASSAAVAGRVLTSAGGPISGATIMIQNLSTGETKYLLTNSYGRYATKGLPVGDFYAVTVIHRRYVFPEPTRYFTLEDNLTDLDFTSR